MEYPHKVSSTKAKTKNSSNKQTKQKTQDSSGKLKFTVLEDADIIHTDFQEPGIAFQANAPNFEVTIKEHKKETPLQCCIRSHTSQVTQETTANFLLFTLPNSPYSPAMAP